MDGVGQEIKRRREARGWTGAQLAVYADMSPSAVSQIETGRRSPNAASMRKLAEALEVEVADLFPKDQAPLPFEDIVQRYSQVPGAIDDLIKQQAEARAREVEDPNSDWFKNPHTASLWLEELSEEGNRLRAWTQEYAPILQPPSKAVPNKREVVIHNLKVLSHAFLTYRVIYRQAKARIEAMDERPDELVLKRLKKAEAGIQELQKAANS